jgi:deoxyribonuclease I
LHVLTFICRINIRWKIPDEYEEMLREWHFSDPPDDWERERNIIIEEIQGNKNSFINLPDIGKK